MRILILENGSSVIDELARTLRASRFAVDVVRCSELAARGASAEDAAVVIVDSTLGTVESIRVLRALRERRGAAPVLMLAARDRIAERVQALEMGADCLGEPFAMPELVAKVRALLRRAHEPRAERIVHGALTFDTAAHRAFLAGAPLALLPREWAVLEVLLRRVESVVSKEMIGELISEHGKPVSPNTIETYVSRLRAKLEPAGVKIRTVYRFGYMLEATTGQQAALEDHR